MNFQERFRNKTSTLSKEGDFSLVPSNTVNHHLPEYKFRSSIQASASFMLNNSPVIKQDVPLFARPIKVVGAASAVHLPLESPKPERIPSGGVSLPDLYPVLGSLEKGQNPRKAMVSATPYRKSRGGSGYSRKYNSVAYVPYTLNDYRVIKEDKYYQLGGLGAISVGTEEWKNKKVSMDRRNEYARKVNMANGKWLLTQNPWMERQEEAKVKSKCEKGLEFAKNIPRPRLKVSPDKEKTTLSLLKELEEKHANYKLNADSIKDKLS